MWNKIKFNLSYILYILVLILLGLTYRLYPKNKKKNFKFYLSYGFYIIAIIFIKLNYKLIPKKEGDF